MPTLDANGLLWALVFVGVVPGDDARPLARARMTWCNLAPLRWLGLRYDSLYALHFPVLWVCLRHASVDGPVAAHAAGGHARPGAAALSVLVAWLGYVAVERPSLARVRAVGQAQPVPRSLTSCAQPATSSATRSTSMPYGRLPR